MTRPADLLFVYGTLMSTAGHAMGVKLAREADLVGPATMKGTLYDFGRYPGMVEAEGGGGGIVHGEVVRLHRPADSLAWLDRYEGISPGQGNAPYERVIREARLVNRTSLKTYVYLYIAAVEGRRVVPGGRWGPGRGSPGGTAGEA